MRGDFLARTSDQKFLPCSFFQGMIFFLENPPISVSWVYLPCFAGHTIRVAHVFIYSVKQESSKNITSPFMATFQTAGLRAFSASDGEVAAHWSGEGSPCPLPPSWTVTASGSPSYLWKLPWTFGPKVAAGGHERETVPFPANFNYRGFPGLSFFFFLTTPLSPFPRLLIQLCNLPNT